LVRHIAVLDAALLVAETTWFAVPALIVTAPELRVVNDPAFGVVPPIAAGLARYVAAFVHAGATAAPAVGASVRKYVPFTVGLLSSLVAPAAIW